MITISQSEIFMWERCRRDWILTYYYGMVPAGESPVGNKQLGGRVAICMEGYYGHQLDPLLVLAAIYKFEIGANPDFEEELRKEYDLAQAMVEGYLEWLAETGADAGLEVVMTETDLQTPLPGFEGSVMLRARMDRVVRDTATGALSFIDDKTAATFDKHELLALDPQFKFYGLMQMLAAGHGVPVPGMELRPDRPLVLGGIVNTLRRVKRTSKSTPPYYLRDPFRYNIEQLASELAKVQSIAAEIIKARAELDFAAGNLERTNRVQRAILYPTPILDDCAWRCPFVTLCPMMDDGSDWAGVLMQSGKYKQDDPYAYYRNEALRTIHEELSK